MTRYAQLRIRLNKEITPGGIIIVWVMAAPALDTFSVLAKLSVILGVGRSQLYSASRICKAGGIEVTVSGTYQGVIYRYGNGVMAGDVCPQPGKSGWHIDYISCVLDHFQRPLAAGARCIRKASQCNCPIMTAQAKP